MGASAVKRMLALAIAALFMVEVGMAG